jgi:hypothetical protein
MNLKHRGPIIDELSRMVQQANHMDNSGKRESTKGSKNLIFEKGVQSTKALTDTSAISRRDLVF